MVGEIRDSDTAEISVRSALTGHLVLSTLHTNDAAGAIPRLLDMKIEPFLLSSAMAGVLAQRLVRRICEKCRQPVEPPAEVIDQLELATARGGYARGSGCRACGNTGYRGRVGIFEVFEVTDPIRDLVAARAPAEELGRAARREGMRTLREDALAKAAEGLTTLEEVLRVTKRDAADQDAASTAAGR
jgi:type II secretory ATPase GspE/PulE/Tfp pilus assembly ATPase PilB-like protein